MTSGEKKIRIESVRQTQIRKTMGGLTPLVDSINQEGLHHPITVWRDGTLISGQRRLMAHVLLGKAEIQAVFVDTVEDAAKQLVGHVGDHDGTMPMMWSEVCRLWDLLRRLDEPAAVRRADENRRRGVELRRQTQAGKRAPGRSRNRGEDYVLTVISEPFGISSATAHRVESIYNAATGPADDKRELARELLRDIDTGGPVWPAYQRLLGVRTAPVVRPRPAAAPVESAPTARQLTAWAKGLPQLDGLVAGLIELGPPNPELTWEQVGPVHTRLMAVRRELEKMIKQMRETSKS